jgi:heat shock protein HslJ
MHHSRWRSACIIALLIAAAAWPAFAGEAFPFGSELMLDVAPMPGSKRIPMLEIEDDGTASIDLWCTSLHAQATVTDDAIAIVPGQPESQLQAPQCDPQRQAGDATLLAALAEATQWRRNGDLIELSGGAKLRYRLMTN